ncbi:F-box/LRR-repeat protein 20-like isoform X2 [Daphnia carinata]|uniref:F-box/LRR-repeat protein 20-like isoform X2 n=1 Tax=Daphnia carinata TaxID=120202 RepID=UPI00257B129B|nr:F-box/LRR-repeat protein 20-like isoform X2 [Daphnia carinata]
MPKRRSPSTLVLTCLKEICSSIDWFSRHHRQQFVCLTSDLVSRIFNRLKTRPDLTAQHFQLVVTDHVNNIDLSNPYQHDEWDSYIDSVLDIIYVRKPNLIRINFSNVLRIPDVFWSHIIQSLTSLQIISLRSTNCSDQQVLTILRHCRNLRELDLSLCERVTNWSISCLNEEAEVGLKLQHLDLMQTQVDERGIRSVLQGCPGLRSLKWRNTINVLGQIYRDLSGNRSLTTPPSFSLHQLISDYSYRLSCLPGAVQLCRHAVQVIIDGPSHLLAKELQSLEHLVCLRFDLILLKHGPTLEHLSLGRIHNVNLQRIAHYCRQLASLSLESNHSYDHTETSTRTIQYLSKFHVIIRDRERVDVDDSVRDVPGLCLSALISSTNMKQIKIRACQTLDDDIFIEKLVGHNLETLELESCSYISMKSLWSVVERSERLSNLKVYRCQLVNYHEIATLHAVINEQHGDLAVDYYSDD